MKRLRGWLFNLAAAVSLVMCLTTLGLYPWMYGWYRIARFSRVTGSSAAPTWECIDFGAKSWTLEVGRMVIHNDIGQAPSQGWTLEANAYRNPSVGFVGPSVMGFGVFDRTWQWGAKAPDWRRTTAISLPIWFFALMFALFPAMRLKILMDVRRARRRSMAFLCAVCGYDLRATPERCPECGTVPEAAKGAGT